jgi:hypothetical protein
MKRGSPEQTARSFRRALDVVAKVPAPEIRRGAGASAILATDEIETILGTKADRSVPSLARFTLPRYQSTQKIDGGKIYAGFGLENVTVFSASSDGLTGVSGRILCLRAGLQNLIDLVRAQDLNIEGIESLSHVLPDQPFAISFTGTATATSLANKVKAIWGS